MKSFYDLESFIFNQSYLTVLNAKTQSRHNEILYKKFSLILSAKLIFVLWNELLQEEIPDLWLRGN